MTVVYRCVGILTVDAVVFFRIPGVFHSQDSFPTTFCPQLWETFSGVVAVGVFAAEALRAGDSQDSNTPIDHNHLARIRSKIKENKKNYFAWL